MTINNSSLLTATRLCGHYLSQHANSNGQYDYIYFADSNQIDNNDYNLIRHCGIVYGLIELYQSTLETEFLRAAETGLAYFQKLITTVEINGVTAATLQWENRPRLGSNGLATLALLKYYQVTQDEKILAQIIALAKWMIATQDQHGQFTVNENDYEKTEFPNFNRGYYPGQAIYALALLQPIDQSQPWADHARKAALYYMQQRANEGNLHIALQHDHWFLYALNHLYRLSPNSDYLHYAVSSVQSILAFQNEDGGFYQPAVTIQTAIRSEGLVQAYNLLKDYSNATELTDKIADALRRSTELQLQRQITAAQADQFPNPNLCLGAMINIPGNFEVRMDSVQHSLSSFLGAMKLGIFA